MSINEKINKLNNQVQWFYSDDFNLDQAENRYKESIDLAKEIEKDLEELKNKIEIIDKEFSK
ncbi:exodeoxyribonuclease VII small subunit [Candidatus Saccharibacteria bacterium]|nr:exodeoxyribonuclease VII small subunit [Candidatus Saccharibacteria bacterium]